MYQIVEYDRHLTENEIIVYLLEDAPVVPAWRLGARVDSVQLTVDGIEHAIDRSFATEDLAATYMTHRLTQLQNDYGMQFEELPRKPWDAPQLVTAYRAYN